MQVSIRRNDRGLSKITVGCNNFLRVYRQYIKSKPAKNWKLTEWFRKKVWRASKGLHQPKKNLVNVWAEIYISVVSWIKNAFSCLQKISHHFYCCVQLEVHFRDQCPKTALTCEYENLGCKAMAWNCFRTWLNALPHIYITVLFVV